MKEPTIIFVKPNWNSKKDMTFPKPIGFWNARFPCPSTSKNV
jgi:hypothetical protein